MLKKYNLIVLHALLCVAPLAVIGKIVAMEPEKVRGITYFNEEERTRHLERIQELQNLFTLNNLGKKNFSINNVKNYTLSPDLKFIFIIHNDDKAELINTQNGFKIGNTFTNVYFDLQSAPLSSDSKFLFIKHNDDTAKLINTQDGKIRYTFTSVHCYEFSTDRKFLFIKYDYNNKIKLINMLDGVQIGDTFTDVDSCKFSPNSKFLLIYHDYNCEAKLINTQDGVQIGDTFTNVDSFEFIHDGKCLSISYRDYQTKLIIIENNSIKKNKLLMDVDFYNCTISPNNKLVIIKYKGNAAKLINIQSSYQIGNTFTDFHYCIFSPDDKFLIIVHNNKTTELINTQDCSQIGNIFTNFIGAIFSPDSQFFIIHSDKAAELINTQDGKICYTFTNANVRNCKFSHDNKFIFIQYLGDTAELINTQDFKRIGNTFTNVYHNETFFSPDDKFLFIIHHNNTAELINTQDGSQVGTAFTDVYYYTFSPDSQFLAINYRNNKDPELYNIENTRSILKTKCSLKFDNNLLILSNNQENKKFTKLFESSKQVVPFKEKLNNMKMLAKNKDRKNGFCDARVHTLE